MKNSPTLRFLTVPGYTNSGPEHWMTLWEQDEPSWSRVQQRDWDAPRRAEWVTTLVAALESDPTTRAVLVAHSLGCVTVVHAAQIAAPRIAAAFLVAPADVEQAEGIEELRGFGPVPLSPLPFPCCVVASDDDPYLRRERAETFARGWGGELHSIGAAGHINTASGLGRWPAGRGILAHFLQRRSLG